MECPECGLENSQTSLICYCGYEFSLKELSEDLHPLTARAGFALCVRAIDRTFQMLSEHGVVNDKVVESIKPCILQMILDDFSEKVSDVIRSYFMKQQTTEISPHGSNYFEDPSHSKEGTAKLLFKLAGTTVLDEMNNLKSQYKEVSMDSLCEALDHLCSSWALLCGDSGKHDFARAFLSDLALIRQIAESEGWTKETPVKPDILGPLWKDDHSS